MPDQNDLLSLLQLALLEVQGGRLPSTPLLTLLLSKVPTLEGWPTV